MKMSDPSFMSNPPPQQNFGELNPPLLEMYPHSKKERLIFLKKQNILFPTLNKNTFEYTVTKSKKSKES